MIHDKTISVKDEFKPFELLEDIFEKSTECRSVLEILLYAASYNVNTDQSIYKRIIFSFM